MFSVKTKILFVLFFIFGSLVIYRLITIEEPKRVKELTYKQGDRLKAEGSNKAGETATRTKGVAGVDKDDRPYRGVIRNPFRPVYPPPPPPPEPVPVAAPVQMAEPPGPSPARIESERFKFKGFLQKDGERKIFVSLGKDIYIVKEGDTVGMLRIGEITENAVTILSRDSSEEFRIMLEDNKGASAAISTGDGRR